MSSELKQTQLQRLPLVKSFKAFILYSSVFRYREINSISAEREGHAL